MTNSFHRPFKTYANACIAGYHVGGAVFDCVCALLCDTHVSPPWPLLVEKADILFTGNIAVKGREYAIISEGNG
jgi:hypothetical protein